MVYGLCLFTLVNTFWHFKASEIQNAYIYWFWDDEQVTGNSLQEKMINVL